MKLFDFLIVPVHRSGGTAIQNFISSHPGIVVIPKWRLDHCLDDHREEELLESFQDLMVSNPEARIGLVQHRRIGEPGGVGSIAERLSKIVRKDGLVMVVRDHFDAVLSGINHRRIVKYCDYSFAKAGLFWPDRVELGRDVQSFLGEVERAGCEPDAPDERLGEEDASIWFQELARVQYAAIQETYEQYFSRATVFDYGEILSTENRNAMHALFETLKADKNFYLPFFSTPLAGTHERFLSHNGISIYSQHVPERTVLLRPVTMNKHAVFDKGSPIGRVYDKYIRDLFAEELCLVTKPPLSASEMAKGQIDAFLRGFFYPLWRKNHKIASRVVERFRVRSLSNEQKSLIKEALAPDATRFFKMNPGLGNSWRESWGSI